MDDPESRNKKHPDTPATKLIKLLAVVAIAAIVVRMVGPVPWTAGKRPLVSRARADMRTYATALEAYFLDEHVYPAWSATPDENAFAPMRWQRDRAIYEFIPTLMTAGPGRAIHTLTTPVPYLTSLLADPLSPVNGQPFCYWTPDPEHGWIAWSAGPDHDYDLTMANIAQAYDPTISNPNAFLIGLTYDPTNGQGSNGDVWRVKE